MPKASEEGRVSVEPIKLHLSRYDKVWLASTRGYAHYAKAFGLSGTALDILYVLERSQGEPLTQSMLVAITGYSKQLIGSVVKDFIRSGYVATEIAPDDHRRKSLVLTEGGQQFATKVVAPLDAVDAKIRALVSDNQWEFMMSLAEEYVVSLEEAACYAERQERDRGATQAASC